MVTILKVIALCGTGSQNRFDLIKLRETSKVILVISSHHVTICSLWKVATIAVGVVVVSVVAVVVVAAMQKVLSSAPSRKHGVCRQRWSTVHLSAGRYISLLMVRFRLCFFLRCTLKHTIELAGLSPILRGTYWAKLLHFLQYVQTPLQSITAFTSSH